MQVVIIEDEILAADRLQSLLHQCDPTIKVICHIDSVKNAIDWFGNNKLPDLAFMDIQLGDGLIFKLFDKMDISCPVIFTTAYDQYALRAFKVFSVDYLLKPIGTKELKEAIDKFKLFNYRSSPQITFTKGYDEMQEIMFNNYKSRFVVKIGDHIQSVPAEKILCFYSDDKITFLQAGNKKYIVEFTLEQLEHLLKPENFFRINRKYIINIESILDIVSHSNGRLRVFLKEVNGEEILVSREKVPFFKNWLNG